MSEKRMTSAPEARVAGQERLSLRKSVLIWVAGAMIGWVFAFVGIYSFLRFTDDAPVQQGRPSLAADFDARSLSAIEPAAGPTAPSTEPALPEQPEPEKMAD